jgi:hypothetical protein
MKIFTKEALERAKALEAIIRENMSGAADRLYAYSDDRGMVLVDNYDSFDALALIVTHEGGLIAHICAELSAYEVSLDQAEYYAKRFFTGGGDLALRDALTGSAKRVY